MSSSIPPLSTTPPIQEVGADPGTYVGAAVQDYVRPPQLLRTIVETGASKGDLPASKILVRGMFGGAFLAYGTAMAFFGIAQGLPPIVADALFPLGFICINLLQVDLATGYFALVPVAYMDGRITFGKMCRCIAWVYVANLIGSLIVAGLLWAALTTIGNAPDATGISKVLVKIGLLKTVHYEQFGMAGAFTAFVKGILCNWFVTLGVVLPYTTRSVIGKAIATFVPIYMFFGMGWEHLVVNMFLIPSAMLYGAHITASDWWIGNELPVTIGNFVGGFLFTGAAIAFMFGTSGKAAAASTREAPAPVR
jgi:formate/nitrite transporter